MSPITEGPEALHAFRERARQRADARQLAQAQIREKLLNDQKLVAGFLRGEMGGKLLELLEMMFDGDTYDTDPYDHAHAAGARSVYLFLKDLKKENPDG